MNVEHPIIIPDDGMKGSSDPVQSISLDFREQTPSQSQPKRHEFYEITELTNDLSNFIPLGTLFLRGFPRLPAAGLDAPDGWKWLELPYDITKEFSEKSNPGKRYLCDLLLDLNYLMNRGYARATYKIQYAGQGIYIAVVRVYLFPGDHRKIGKLNKFRSKFFSRGSLSSVNYYSTIIRRLLMVLDYSVDTWNFDKEKEENELITRQVLLGRIVDNHGLVFNSLQFHEKPISKGTLSKRAYIPVDNIPESDLFIFHLQRFINNSPYSPFEETTHQNSALVDFESSKGKDSALQERLISVYNSIKSPSFNHDRLNGDFKVLFYEILNNEIPGFKSQLYPYQRHSVAKMLEHESYIKTILQPNVIEIKNSRRNSGNQICYFNIESLKIMTNPLTYETPRGGILAENMGFGKTCICLALICISKNQISEMPKEYKNSSNHNEKFASSVAPLDGYLERSSVKSLFELSASFITSNGLPWKEYIEELPYSCIKQLENNPGYYKIFEYDEKSMSQYNTRSTAKLQSMIDLSNEEMMKRVYLSSTTLIVVPDNLWHQWKFEIKKHVEPDFLKVLDVPNIQVQLPEIREILKCDIVLMTLSSFARQAESQKSPLRNIRWKRFIIDEGHSMNSKGSRAVSLAKELHVERKWAITGTPTAGLTNLHVNEEIEESRSNTPQLEEYTIKQKFNTKDDLFKLGMIISNFLQIKPWYYDSKLWGVKVVKPFIAASFNSELQLRQILETIIVRHSLNDIEEDIKLPPLHHKPVFLEPSFFDKLSINLFIAVLATNAVTSERTDKDYMFHPSNKSELRRLITNLQRATFYWTGFTANDIQTLLKICESSIKDSKYSDEDDTLLRKSIFISKAALSNSRWRTITSIHEMNYYIDGLPLPFIKHLSTGTYSMEDGRQIGIYGAPQVHNIQKFFFKNRLVKSLDILKERLQEHSRPFWENYWKVTEKKNIQRVKKKEGQSIDGEISIDNTNIINLDDKAEDHDWMETFDVVSEEKKLLIGSPIRNGANKRPLSNGGSTSKITTSPKKKKMYKSALEELSLKLDKNGIKSLNSALNFTSNTPETDDTSSYFSNQELSSNLRKARILGTASAKLSYLAARLMEHQKDGVKSIVFFEFEDSAYYLTELLDILGLNYILYATFIKQNERSSNLSKFSTWDTDVERGGITLIMDLRLASHGLTIISATRVYFVNPVWKKTVEAQAIKRAHRIGQRNEVFVETLILKNTIEEEMYRKRRGKDNDNADAKDETNTVIDDTGMQEYIMKHEFLPMFSSGHPMEYEPLCSPAINQDSIVGLYNHRDTSPNYLRNDDYDANSESDEVRLFEPMGKLDPLTNVRSWNVPVFTESSLEKINEVENKMKDVNKLTLKSGRDISDVEKKMKAVKITKKDSNGSANEGDSDVSDFNPRPRSEKIELSQTLNRLRNRSVRFG